ncbi:MarR family winged helix-turn-helix transcriptional regulator [Alicyclobacillus fastidiosus]|uniref:MarR family transcriptional regulator n=1 Tax=Alicyclobacillus fastidiosus TaxID=392011 RepID=A0ABV5AFQ2_9BACL|nr:MarR family transcriptional regulator [Alicyclobacillus fastidiosus]WEH11646.1 MarR family transcriptional regulator [Alicyclobacillus fastidiosus]
MSGEYSDYVVEIEHCLRSVAATVRRKGRILLSDYGLTSPQFEALIVLDREGELTIGELSGKLYLAYSTTTDLVDRLEKSNYVTRQRCSDDRRVVRVRLEPQGVTLIEGVLNARRNYLDSVLASVDTHTRKTILDSLELLHMNMANQ